MAIETRNPATGEVVRSFEPHGAAHVDQALDRAVDAFSIWRLTPFAERAALMRAMADILDQRRQRLAELATLEVGKTIASARAEVEKCALVCRYYAENGEKHLAAETFDSDASRSYVAYQPLGLVFAVMPWNFPYWQLFRFAAPALTAGNVGVLKHSSNVPQCALAIEETFRDAGFPEGVFTTLLIGSAEAEKLVEDPRIAAVTLTGSDAAGAKVAAAAGRVVKKCVLELGGSDPFIVMGSADIEKAAATAAKARMINNGQSCIAAKRFLVHDSVYDDFARRFVEAMRSMSVGNPMDENVDLGPLATEQVHETLVRQVEESVSAGAKLLVGGQALGSRGFFYAPTVLSDIPESAPLYRDEVFGPAASLFRVSDIDQAIRLANDTPYGLASSVWTNDEDERQRFARDIEAGSVFVNAMVASDPRLPFGGIKQSGYGRELSRHGIREFVNAKTVSIA